MSWDRKEATAGDGIRRLWDLVMKFGGEFGGYGDTSFRPARTPLLPSVALLSSFNANVAGEGRFRSGRRRRKGRRKRSE